MKLLLAAQTGDEFALGSLMAHCCDYLLLIANEDMDRGLQAKFGASDFVQQTMLAAHQHIRQFRGESLEEFKGWLRQILHNDINRVRRQFVHASCRQVDREQRLDDANVGARQLADSLLTPGSDALLREQARMLKDALSQLPETYQQVIQLRDWDELTFPQIGERMCISEEAARKLWKRAITKLEDILAPQLGDLPGPASDPRNS